MLRLVSPRGGDAGGVFGLYQCTVCTGILEGIADTEGCGLILVTEAVTRLLSRLNGHFLGTELCFLSPFFVRL